MVSNTMTRKEELEHLIDGTVERFLGRFMEDSYVRYFIEKYDLVGELTDEIYGYYGGTIKPEEARDEIRTIK